MLVRRLISIFMMMIFSPRNSFAGGQSQLIVILLSSTLCSLVNSYAIDDSCQNYKGIDIRQDIHQAIVDVQDMAWNAFSKTFQNDPNENTRDLLQVLFGGTNPSSWHTFSNSLVALFHFLDDADFVIICNDLTVNLVPDIYTQLLDPRGLWRDDVHNWIIHYENYFPCDIARQPVVRSFEIGAFTVSQRLIYVCPSILDHPLGRVLAPYRDQILAGKMIEDFFLLPAILFHELFHTGVVTPIRKFSFRS